MTAKFRSKNIAEAAFAAAAAVVLGVSLSAQKPTGPPPAPPAAPKPPASAVPAQAKPVPPPANPGTAAAVAAGVTVPSGYVIGPEDVLSILFWKDKEMSSDVAVRPDGKISLPLLNDIEAAGLTPEQLGARLMEASRRYIEDPNVTVVVKAINSRKVFVTGEINKTGAYALTGPTTVLQLIALAGGLRDFADSKNILIVRVENGKPVTYKFNYKDFTSRKNLSQNIELKPGDTIIVP
jgi:polysaccharide export outer membrane protein